jgi:hypothetical protein
MFAISLLYSGQLRSASRLIWTPKLAESGQSNSIVEVFRPESFGTNITESLLNPAEPEVTSKEVDRQVAAILYDLRMMGGRVARWMVSDVWPQWRCNQDPEDQLADRIDPAWFKTAGALLEEAARQHVKVVVVLSDPTGPLFGSTATDPVARAAMLNRWADYRRSLVGKDGYDHQALPECQPTNSGYYGAATQEMLFTNPVIRSHLSRRFALMAKFLVNFTALGALELFNEPDFRLTRTPAYWSAVREFVNVIRGADARLAGVAVFSGTATWDGRIAAEARRSGALEAEPFLTVHAYDDYTQDEAKIRGDLRDMIAYLHGLAPGKPVVIAEAGSKIFLHDPADNAKMVRILLDTYLEFGVGVWVWGNWFPQPDRGDYKWLFNHRSSVGESLRPYFFDVDRERSYAESRNIAIIGASTPAGAESRFGIGQVPNSERDWRFRGMWAVEINGRRHLGFSRAGVFRRPFPGHPLEFSPPPSTFFITDPGEHSQWAEISYNNGGWILRLSTCVRPTSDNEPTSKLLIALASAQKRDDFLGCQASALQYSAQL